jgi:hypothetical protein
VRLCILFHSFRKLSYWACLHYRSKFCSGPLLLQFFGDDWQSLFEAITGYGLGGSSIALFGRVGGGIYTKVGIGGCSA